MSQQDFVQAAADLGSLLQINYRGKVKPWLGKMAPLAALFDTLGPGQYKIDGKNLRFAADAIYAGMAMGTDGHLPASQYVDPVNLDTTPARMYVRRAVDNFVQAQGGGSANFEDFFGRIMRQMWEAFERMECRHVNASSDATVCHVNTRTSATVVVVDNGYGHAGQSPLQFLEPGMWLAALDASNAFATLGAAVIDSIDYSTNTITFATDIDDGATVVADGDPLVFSTSPNTADSYFVTERGNAPLGLLDIIDPNEDNSSYLTVTESEFPRVKPLRRASADWGEVEFMEFIAELGAKSQVRVTPDSHTMSLQPGALIELAKTLVTYTQIQQKGKELAGGWTTVRLAGHDFLEDPYHLWDVMYAHHMEDYHQVDLDGEKAIYSEDGSQFQRLADFDGKEWFARHYTQRFASRRNTLGALTGITNPNSSRYSPEPS